jgi:8-oxo-dGTP diphosphatase
MSQVVTSAKGLIFQDGKFLLIKERLRKRDIWDLPGGKIEYGETPQVALIREVKEELSIDVKVGKSVGVYWFVTENHQRQVICHTFLCTPPQEFKIDFSQNPAVNEEIIDYKWVTKEEFLGQEFDHLNDSLRELVATL